MVSRPLPTSSRRTQPLSRFEVDPHARCVDGGEFGYWIRDQSRRHPRLSPPMATSLYCRRFDPGRKPFGALSGSESGAPRRLTVTTQMLIDATAVATVVAGTGAEESPFSFVFLLVIMNGVNLEGRAGAFISALAVCVAFAADITLTGNRGEWYVHLPSPAELGTWLTHVAAFFSAAWLGSVLEDRAAKVRVALAELEDIHEQVVESLPHGLLVTSSDGRVSMENPTARSMLAQGTLIGKLIHEALPALGQAPNSGEREVVHRVGQERRVLRCSFKPLGDGTLVTLENFTNLRGMEQRVIQSESLAGVGRICQRSRPRTQEPAG